MNRRFRTFEVTFRTGTVIVRARLVGEAVQIARRKLGARAAAEARWRR